jgi:hypothetical protein
VTKNEFFQSATVFVHSNKRFNLKKPKGDNFLGTIKSGNSVVISTEEKDRERDRGDSRICIYIIDLPKG